MSDYEFIFSDGEKSEIYKKARTFQKAEKHLTLKSFSIKMLYHHLTAELCL